MTQEVLDEPREVLPNNLIQGYEFNGQYNRAQRRSMAKRQGVFKIGIWQIVGKVNNVQTVVNEERNIRRQAKASGYNSKALRPKALRRNRKTITD